VVLPGFARFWFLLTLFLVLPGSARSLSTFVVLLIEVMPSELYWQVEVR
jgi:hypothetical protein